VHGSPDGSSLGVLDLWRAGGRRVSHSPIRDGDQGQHNERRPPTAPSAHVGVVLDVAIRHERSSRTPA